MADGIEGWHLLDLESGLLPDRAAPSLLPGAGRGRIIVLAATPFARTDDWASRAAVLLSRDWAQEGLRIFLMDLNLEEPSLHEALGLPNGEGITDAFLFGASIQHIALPALENAIYFAPAGAPPGDTQEVLGHPRWNDLAGGFSEADATLLLFLPTDIAGAEKILSRATDIVFLAARGESPEEHLGPAFIKVVTTMGPLGTPTVLAEINEESISESPEGRQTLEEEEDVPDFFTEEVGDDSLLSSEGTDLDLDFEESFELASGFTQSLEEERRESQVEGAPEVTPDEGKAMEGPPEGEISSGPVSPEEEVNGSAGGPPDFEVDFVDLPPTGGTGPQEMGGGFGDDLVQGPDFGSPPTVPEAPPETEAEPHPFEVHETAEETEAPVPLPERRRPPRRTPPRRPIPWGVIAVFMAALAILAGAVGTALGYMNLPGFTQLRDLFSEIPDPPLTLGGPQANEEVLRYSLVLFTYDQEELADAQEMLAALQERLPDLLLTLVPGEENGSRTYTLLAGPAVDRVDAENLRGPIAEVLTREDPASWSVRETPRAFYLGERGTLGEAEEYRESVTSEDIYTYILHVTFPDPDEPQEELESYQVLSGAFAGVRDARPLQMILRERGLRDAPLIERRGHLPE